MELLILREDFDQDSAPKASGRTLTIRLATLGRVYTVGRERGKVLRERIAPDAFKEPLARPHGVLRYRHIGERDGEQDNLDNIHGVITRMWRDGDQILSEVDVFPGEVGDKILRIAPALEGASMSAIVRESRKGRDARGELTEIIRIGSVNGVSLTPKPAYDDAAVLAVREAPQDPADLLRSRRAAEAERLANAAARRLLLQSR